MTNQLINLHFQDHHIRSMIDEHGNPWFVAKDVFIALELDWSGKSLAPIPDEWKGMGKFPTPGGTQEFITISEPALYMIAFRSNKTIAIKFTMWVANDVLPSIRKSGKYIQPSIQDSALPKGGLSHLPTVLTKADAEDKFSIFSLRELGIALGQKIPEWIKNELTLKTRDEIYELAKAGSPLAKHIIKSLFGFDVENPQLSF